jgi:hypothetical protein
MTKTFKISRILSLAALAAAVLVLMPRSANKAEASGALCGMVQNDTPYYYKYCMDGGYQNNNTGYNYNYPTNQNMNYNSSYGYNSTCQVVETNSPYYQQNCQGYNSYQPTSYPTQTSGNYNYNYNYNNYGQSGCCQNSNTLYYSYQGPSTSYTQPSYGYNQPSSYGSSYYQSTYTNYSYMCRPMRMPQYSHSAYPY